MTWYQTGSPGGFSAGAAHRAAGNSAADTHEIAYNIIASAGHDYSCSGRHSAPLVPDLDEEDSLRTEALLKRLEDGEEIDLSFTVPNLIRVRANLYLQRGCMGAALRIIPLKPLTMEELGLPPVLKELATQAQGLVLVTGPTGSGKSTTLAAVIGISTARAPATS